LGHPRQVDLPHDDLLVGYAEHDLLGRELRRCPEVLDRLGHDVDVDNLAVTHRAGEVVDVDIVSEAIKHLWTSAKFSTKKVVLGVANQKVIVRQVDLPWMPE